MSQTFTIRSERVLTPEGVRSAFVQVEGGKIHSIGDSPGEGTLLDVGNDVLLPGLVDSHVHVNQPGRTEWEGFETATRAAAAGGVTTLIDMPLNSIPVTVSPESLQAKSDSARDHCWIDYGFWGGVVPGPVEPLESILRFGLPGAKCFLVPSGIEEFGFVGEKDLRVAMPVIAKAGAVLLVHAELPGPIDAAQPQGDPRTYRHFLESRPREAENEAIELMISLAQEFNCRVHIVHLSSSDALGSLARARKNGVPITVETCPHYLTFDAESIPDRQTQYKCAPPIRERENRDLLWDALGEGVIDMVVSDHSPCTPELKLMEEGDFEKAWGGIASLQFGLPAVWTEARKRGYGIEDVLRWMSLSPARLAGVSDRKGSIRVGADADLVVWDPEADFTVGEGPIHHRHSVTPYSGKDLKGEVKSTFLRGEKIYEKGEFSPTPLGRNLIR
ncbi:MAG: allantoinase AllB [Planctomycetota bacterium]|nr:allantoinase AllB [Planctomycetota bacterium]